MEEDMANSCNLMSTKQATNNLASDSKRTDTGRPTSGYSTTTTTPTEHQEYTDSSSTISNDPLDRPKHKSKSNRYLYDGLYSSDEEGSPVLEKKNQEIENLNQLVG